MMGYLLYASFLIAVFYLFYQYLLKDETFFGLNRGWLLTCIFLAFLVPLLKVPEAWSLRTAITEEPVEEIQNLAFSPDLIPPVADPSSPSLSEAVYPLPVQKESTVAPMASSVFASWQLTDWLWLLYWLGVSIFTLNFFIQFLAIFWQRMVLPSIKDGRFRIVELNGSKAPFSFWNTIFINPTRYDWDTYQQILEHEKIHASHKHSLDILLAEVLVILQWFNPFAWRYRKAVEHNLEYSTDSSMLRKGTDPESYQMNLLKVAVPNLPLTLTTNYNQSILKQRIIMMNAKRSSVRSSWKYFFLVPLIGLAILCFNTPFVSGQHTDFESGSTSVEAELEAEATVIAQAEIPEPVSQVLITEEGTEIYGPSAQLATNGNWTATIEGNEVCIFLKKEDKSNEFHWGRTSCFTKSTFSNLPIGKEGTFQLKGESGTITFKGKFDGDEGEGTYQFQEDSSFKSYLESSGFKKADENTLLHLCFAQMGKEDVEYLKKQGFKNLDSDDLEAVAAHGLDKDAIDYYVKGFKSLGFDQLKLDEVMALSIHEVKMDYVKELGDLVYDDLSIDNVIAASIHDVQADYIRAFQAAGFKDVDFDHLIAAAIHDVDVEYIKAFQAAGFEDLDFDDLIGAAIHDVDPEYIKNLKAAGIEDLDFDEVIAGAIHGVDPDYIKTFQAAGFEDLDFDDMIAASIHNVDPAYIKAFQDAGFEDLDFDDLISASIHNIDPEYIRGFNAAGFEDLDFDDLVAASIHNIDLEYIKSWQQSGMDIDFDEMVSAAIHNIDMADVKAFQQAGLEDLDFDQVISFGIHGIKPDYVKSMQALGFEDLDGDELISAHIHGVDAAFIKKARAEGHTDLDLEEYVELKLTGSGKSKHKGAY